MSYFVFFCLLVRDTIHFGAVFMKMIQQTAKSAAKNDGDF